MLQNVYLDLAENFRMIPVYNPFNEKQYTTDTNVILQTDDYPHGQSLLKYAICEIRVPSGHNVTFDLYDASYNNSLDKVPYYILLDTVLYKHFKGVYYRQTFVSIIEKRDIYIKIIPADPDGQQSSIGVRLWIAISG